MYDILIVGGGPAGITAAIYAHRAGKKIAIIEKFMLGGQVGQIAQIENYPGIASIDGPTLAQNFKEQIEKLDIERISDEILSYDLTSTHKKLIGRKGSYEAKAVILALGSHPRQLKIEGEEKFLGSGVSYCAICDGNFFRGADVVVVGSGNSALSDAKYLAGICKSVTVLTKYAENFDSIKHLKNIKIIENALCTRVEGGDSVEKVFYSVGGKTKNVKVRALFVAIGRQPETDSLNGQIKLNEKGYIVVDKNMQTSIEGVYACGDVVDGSLKQIVTATGDGATAAISAIQFIGR